MRNRGKEIESFNEEPYFTDTFSSSLEFPCKKHPPSSSSSSSGGGICPFCLRDKLTRLVCPECGEQRLPTCSCSAPKTWEPEILRRSNSISAAADVNPRGGFWGFKKLFRKKREKNEFAGTLIGSGNGNCDSNVMGVTRSRSLCSFRGGGGGVGGGGGGGGGGVGGGLSFYDAEEGGMIHSAARASSVSGGFVMESAKRSCFSESEARMSNFEGRMSNFDYERDLIGKGIYTMREGYELYNMEDPKFIDLKLELPSSSSSEMRGEHYGYRKGEYYGGFNNGGGSSSCRLSVSENELKKCRKSRKGWRWLFKASSNLGKEKG